MLSRVLTLDVRSINLRAKRIKCPVSAAWLKVVDNQKTLEKFFELLSKARILVPGNPQVNRSIKPYCWQDSSLRHLTPFYTTITDMANGLRNKGEDIYKLSYIINYGCSANRYFTYEEIEELAKQYGQPLVNIPPEVKTKAGQKKPITKQAEKEIVADPATANIDLGAWKTENELALMLNVKPVKIRQHLKAVLNAGNLGSAPLAIKSDKGDLYNLEVIYHIACRLKGLAGSQEASRFSIVFSGDTLPAAKLPKPSTALPKPSTDLKISALEKDNKQLQYELNNKDAALSLAVGKIDAADQILREKIDSLHSFYGEKISYLQQINDNISRELIHIARELIIPTCLEDILKISDLFFKIQIQVLPEARLSANQYQATNDPKIIAEAWEMIVSLGVHLYDMKFKEKFFRPSGLKILPTLSWP